MLPSSSCVVSSCCCGCSLRTGSLIIGWLSLICDVLLCGMYGYLFQVAEDGFLWVNVFMTIVHIVVSILLLIGISQKKIQFIKEFVYVNYVWVVLNGIACIAYFIMAAYVDFPEEYITQGVVHFFDFFIVLYFTVVVASYGISLEEAPMQPTLPLYQQFDQPGQLGQPGQPGQPGWQPAQPGQPGWQPAQPGQPGWQPAQPGQPGWQPAQPGQPGLQPAQPGIQSVQLGQPLWQPGKPVQAGIQPVQYGQPAWQPLQPGEAPPAYKH